MWRKRFVLLGLMGLLCSGLTWAQEEKSGKTDKPKSEKPVSQVEQEKITPELKTKIEELIKKLGDEDWQTREAAQRQLIEIGESALPMLEEAEKNSNDPEVKMRIKNIFRPRYLFKKLSNPQQAESAVMELIVPALRLGHDPLRQKGYIQPLKISSVTFINRNPKETLAVVFLDWAGHFNLSRMCGTGMTAGGISSPDLNKQGKTAESLIIIRDDGIPLVQISKSRSECVLMDADGDGKIQELVRWDNSCDYGRPPFLIIHDLTKENLPAMVNLRLNPEAGRDLFEVIHSKGKNIRNPDGTISVTGEVTIGPRMKSARHGTWKFEPVSGYQNIIIEEQIKNQLNKVATFSYDSSSRTWLGPAGSEKDFWIVNNDSSFRAYFTDLTKTPKQKND